MFAVCITIKQLKRIGEYQSKFKLGKWQWPTTLTSLCKKSLRITKNSLNFLRLYDSRYKSYSYNISPHRFGPNPTKVDMDASNNDYKNKYRYHFKINKQKDSQAKSCSICNPKTLSDILQNHYTRHQFGGRIKKAIFKTKSMGLSLSKEENWIKLNDVYMWKPFIYLPWIKTLTTTKSFLAR